MDMKKILIYLTIMAAVVSCDLYGGPEISAPADKAAGIEISFSEVTDYSFKVTITPTGEAAYYSYLVDESNTAETLDAANLYAVKYSSVAQGTVKWTSDAPSVTLTVSKLAPNTTYQVYAVAGSPKGIPGEIAVKSVVTTDGGAPALTDYDYEDNTVALLFSEEVTYAGGAVTAKYYAYNSDEMFDGEPIGTVTASAEDIVVDGDVVYVTFSGFPAGAFYAVDYPAGTFKDLTGNACAAVESTMSLDEEWEVVAEGVCCRAETADFALGELEIESLAEYTTPILVDFGSEYGYGYTYKTEGSVVYSHSGKTTSMTLTADSDFGYSLSRGGVVIYLPEEPEKGDEVKISIPAKTFEDYYGNYNEAWEGTLVYSYGYTLDDILGTYRGSFTTVIAIGKNWTGEVVISESDDEEYGNVMIEGFVGMPEPLYATFDPVYGTLSIETQQLLGMAESSAYLFSTFSISGSSLGLSLDPTTFQVPAPGKIQSPDHYFGIIAVTGTTAAFVDAYNPSTASFTRTGTASSSAVSKTAVRTRPAPGTIQLEAPIQIR